MRNILGKLFIFMLAAGGPCFGQGFVKDIRLDGYPGEYFFHDGETGMGSPGAVKNISAPEAERVKRLALFYLWLEREPFFLSPRTDLGDLEQAARLLGSEEKQFLEMLGLRERLYPAEFLDAYAKASAAFDLFSGSPSEGNALKVLDKIRDGVRAYADRAAGLEVSVTKRFDESKMDVLAGFFGENVTNRKVMLSDLSLINRNAAAASARLKELEKCLLASSGSCRSRWTDKAPLPPARAQAAEAPLLDLSGFGYKNTPLRGPYLINTACWGGRKTNYLYAYEKRGGPQNALMEWDILATDFLFRILFDAPAFKTMFSRGIKLLPMIATAVYGCNDLEFMPVLRTIDHFTVNYSSKPVAAESPVPGVELSTRAASVVEAALAAEKSFFGEKIKSQDGLERLGESYLKAFNALEGVNYSGRADFLERSRLISLRTSGFGHVINRATFHLGNFRRRIAARYKTREAFIRSVSLFLTRSHYSLCFMPFSPSVWIIPEKPAYLSGDFNRDTRMAVNYQQALEIYGQAEVDKTIKYFEDNPRGDALEAGGI